MMKTLGHVAVAAGLVMVGSTGAAIAGPMGTTGIFSLTRVTELKDGAGGEFTVYNVKTRDGAPSNGLSNASYSANPATKNVPNPFPGGTPIPESFQTFCLEQTEDALLASQSLVNHFVVNSEAAEGGGGSVNGRDPISKGTAWLYSQFAQGLLNVTPDPTNNIGDYFNKIDAAVDRARKAEAGFLQKAIWWLEEESSPLPEILAANPYYQAAIAQFGGRTAAMANATEGFLGVYVLNNFRTADALQQFLDTGTASRSLRGQDFLYYYKEDPPDVSVPDGGATLALLGTALVALGALRRRRS
jgi:hypothetical protein